MCGITHAQLSRVGEEMEDFWLDSVTRRILESALSADDESEFALLHPVYIITLNI